MGPESAPGTSHYSDGRPSSRHTGWNLQFINARDRMFYIGGWALWGNGNGSTLAVDAFNPATNDYEPAGTYRSLPEGAIYNAAQAVCKDSQENVWLQNLSSGNLYRWNRSDGSVTFIGSRSAYNLDTAMCHDPVRNRLVRFDTAFGARFDLNNNAAETRVTFGGPQASKAANGSSVVWCAARGSFLIFRWNENNVYECNPETFEITTLTVAGPKPPPPINDGQGTLYGRWFYAPELRLCGYIRSVDDNVWVFRV